MMREFSAGGVVIRRADGIWSVAVIELPVATNPTAEPGKRKVRSQPRAVLCLPKGLIDTGEKPLDAALREVREETGITAALVTKLGDIKYVYVRSWGDRERVFKIVSFFLFRYESGEIDDITEEMRVEVGRAIWVPLDEAPRLLAYSGEKEMAKKALTYIEGHTEL